MSLQAQRRPPVISLKGSAEEIARALKIGFNSILFLRGVYPSDAFVPTSAYGLTVQMNTDLALSSYINANAQQAEEWLADGKLKSVVLEINRACHPYDTLERWTFDVETDEEVLAGRKEAVKPQEQTNNEIAALIRQIAGSLTFLPLLDVPCTFALRFVVAGTANASAEWEESRLKAIPNSEDMPLRSFSTKVHKVDPMVTYQVNEFNL